MASVPYLHSCKNGVVLEVVLTPRASQNKILGMYNERLKVSIMAPPVDGKANAALCKYIAKLIGVPPSNVSVIRGQTSREKSLEILGISEEDVLSALDL